MKSTKKCGRIRHNGKYFEVEWEVDSKLVWVVDQRGFRKKRGERKADSENEALKVALEMLESV